MASKTGTAILLPENEEQARLQNLKAQGQQQQQQQPDEEWDTEEQLSMGIDSEGHPVPEEEEDDGKLPTQGSHYHHQHPDLYGAMTEDFD